MKKLRLAKFTDEILPLEAKLKPLLRLAWPEGSDESISGLTVDLSGLWEVSRKHIAIVRTLLTMGTAMDTDQLRELSQELDSNWLSYASDHMKSLRVDLSRFQRDLYRTDQTKPLARAKALTRQPSDRGRNKRTSR